MATPKQSPSYLPVLPGLLGAIAMALILASDPSQLWLRILAIVFGLAGLGIAVVQFVLIHRLRAQR
jgi:hypothetical protein